MKIAFLMDPLESVKAYKDTTYFLMLAAYERGNEVFYFNQATIQAGIHGVRATVSKLKVDSSIEQPFAVLEKVSTDLSAMDVIVVRTDPPFDRAYLYSTLLLDLVGSNTQVINRPSGIRNWNEKLAALHYPEFTPDTLVTKNVEEILDFVSRHNRVTLKPVDGHGGEGIEFLDKQDKSAKRKIDEGTRSGNHWVIVQEYLEAAQQGDKRILLVDGNPIGGVLRVHAEGEELNNLDRGGQAVPTELVEVDYEICAAIKPGLVEQGIFFSGIDVIGGKLIEVNVTSPTCLQELCRFSGIQHHHNIIEKLEIRTVVNSEL